MPTIKLEAPASEELLNWQKTMLYAQLQLLGDHAGDHERCACEKKDETGEFCIAKHLTAIAEGYCTETIPMTGDESLKQALSQIRNGATDLRREYLEAMTAGKEPPYDLIAQFAREARKELEPFLWQYKGGGEHTHELHQVVSPCITLHQAKPEPRWCFGVKSVDKQRKEAFWEEAMRQTDRETEPALTPALFSNVCTGGRCYNTYGGELKMASEMGQKTTKLSYIEHIIHHELCFGRLKRTDEAIASFAKLLYKESLSELEEASRKIYAEAYDRGVEVTTAIYQGIGKPVPVYLSKELKMADSILAEVASQICSTGICLGEPKKKSPLPICTASQKKDRESCIRQLKPRQKAGEIKSAYAICNVSVGCRPGGRKEKVK